MGTKESAAADGLLGLAVVARPSAGLALAGPGGVARQERWRGPRTGRWGARPPLRGGRRLMGRPGADWGSRWGPPSWRAVRRPGPAVFFGMIWLYGGVAIGSALLALLVLIALGQDHRSQALKRFAETQDRGPGVRAVTYVWWVVKPSPRRARPRRGCALPPAGTRASRRARRPSAQRADHSPGEASPAAAGDPDELRSSQPPGRSPRPGRSADQLAVGVRLGEPDLVDGGEHVAGGGWQPPLRSATMRASPRRARWRSSYAARPSVAGRGGIDEAGAAGRSAPA